MQTIKLAGSVKCGLKSSFTTGARAVSNEAVFRLPASSGKGNRAVVSMAKTGAAAGYAAALLEVGKSSGSLEAIHKDVEALSTLVQDVSFKSFLDNPLFSDGQKKKLLETVAKDSKLTAATVNLLNILVDRKRIGFLDEVTSAFEELYYDETDTQVAVVTSAVKLENSQQALIAKKLQSITGAKNIKLKNIVDASLIAGFVVKYGKDGSNEIDMSVKGQLDLMESQFNEAQPTLD